jgi:hypothetical protein
MRPRAKTTPPVQKEARPSRARKMDPVAAAPARARARTLPPPAALAPRATLAPQRLLAPRSATNAAAGGLLVFAVLTGLALAAWFKSVPLPWTVGSVIAMSTAAGAFMMSLVVWRAPSQSAVITGACVIAASLLRLGMPSSWTVMSAVVFDLTVLVSIPVVRAALCFTSE